MDFHLGDLPGSWRAKTIRECAAACGAKKGCTAFTFIPDWDGCYLKGGHDWYRKSKKSAQSVELLPCAGKPGKPPR